MIFKGLPISRRQSQSLVTPSKSRFPGRLRRPFPRPYRSPSDWLICLMAALYLTRGGAHLKLTTRGDLSKLNFLSPLLLLVLRAPENPHSIIAPPASRSLTCNKCNSSTNNFFQGVGGEGRLREDSFIHSVGLNSKTTGGKPPQRPSLQTYHF